MAEKHKGRGPRQAPRCSGPDIWDIQSWCDQFGIGYSTFYTLEPKPERITLGERLIRIKESPAAYALRVGVKVAA